MRKKSNAARRLSEEAVADIRVREEVERAKIEREEDDNSDKVDADMTLVFL